MNDFLDTLQQKPEHVRRRIAFGGAAAVGLVLLGFWTISAKGLFNSQATSQTASVYAPIQSLGETIRGGIGELKLYAKELTD